MPSRRLFPTLLSPRPRHHALRRRSYVVSQAPRHSGRTPLAASVVSKAITTSSATKHHGGHGPVLGRHLHLHRLLHGRRTVVHVEPKVHLHLRIGITAAAGSRLKILYPFFPLSSMFDLHRSLLRLLVPARTKHRFQFATGEALKRVLTENCFWIYGASCHLMNQN
jgi:hypothetical protein